MVAPGGEALGGVVGAFRHMIQTKGLIVAFGVLTWTLLEYTLSSLPFPHRNQELLVSLISLINLKFFDCALW